MKYLLRHALRPVGAVLLGCLLFVCSPGALAQHPAVRLSGPITGGPVTALAGSRPPLAALSSDAGVLPSGTAIQGLTLEFSRSAAQEADLEALLAAQQNPASPQYHQWLTPETFGARFGVADADLAQVESWLQSEGFTVTGPNRSRNSLMFSGTAGSVAAAFGTELHRYKLNGVTHFAPATDLSLPAALAPLVMGVLHTSDFRPQPSVHIRKAAAPDYTSSQSQEHYLTPGDVATMYNVQAEYSAGYTGVGQSIAVVGQSYVNLADITAFRTAAGLVTNTPTLVLVPGTGVSAISTGDEGESDIDLEYAGGMAPGASVYLVYSGNNTNASVFDALDYAISENIAPVLSISYGVCEPLASTTTLNSYSAIYMQAAAQGQSIFASSGDSGSEACYGYSGESTAVQEQLAVNFPASSPYVTAVGGTQMASGTFAAGSSTYWTTASGTDVISSLLSYVPETTWNEDSTTNGVIAGGGGASAVFARPSWQTGVTGIPTTGTTRLLPDVSLLSAVNSPGYLYCSSDISSLEAENLTSSCASGFRDSSGKYLLIAGGTSFAAPVMAGMTALLNQVKHSTGQGLLNTEMYALAASSTTYASAFHDITSGTNACTIASTTYCSTAGASGYAAGTGYDEATGLGSVSLANLISAWPSTTATALPNSVTTLAPATAQPVAGAADVITINVSSTSTSTVTPTGTVALSVDGTSVATVTLVNGAATYSYTASTTSGSHVITAVYSGDSGHAASRGATTITITAGSVAAGSFTFTVGNITAASGSTGSSAVSIVPASGYNGNVVFTLTVPSTAPTICYEMEYGSNYAYAVPVSGTTAATLVLGVGTSVCGTTSGDPYRRMATVAAKQASNAPHREPWRGKPVLTMMAGLLVVGFTRRRSRRLPTLLAAVILTVAGLGLSGCTGSGTGTGQSTTTTTSTTAASYTLTLTGTDSVTSTITSSTTFTLTL